MSWISVSIKILLELAFSFFLHLAKFLAQSNILWQCVPQTNCKLHENVLPLIRKGALVWLDRQILLVLPFHWCAIIVHWETNKYAGMWHSLDQEDTGTEYSVPALHAHEHVNFAQVNFAHPICKVNIKEQKHFQTLFSTSSIICNWWNIH